MSKKTNSTKITQRPTLPRAFAINALRTSAVRLQELSVALQDECEKEILKAVVQALDEEDGTEPEEEEEE
jgi:hypothetical protein